MAPLAIKFERSNPLYGENKKKKVLKADPVISMSTKEEIDALFKKYEELVNESQEYVPVALENTQQQPPVYIPTPKEAGPKRITIEQYKARQEKNRNPRVTETKYTITKKRGGKKRKFEATCRDLQRVIDISQGTQKKSLIKQLIELKKVGWKNFN